MLLKRSAKIESRNTCLVSRARYESIKQADYFFFQKVKIKDRSMKTLKIRSIESGLNIKTS